MTDPDLIRIEARLSEAQEAEKHAAARVRELTEALAVARLAESTAGESDLEARLEAGPWKEATSKKCDYWRDAPSDLVQAVRSTKGGIKGQSHHFTAAVTEPTLFRFRRGTKA
ncbi:MAG: hypothetical protein JRN18_00290 [Nitrososphaerota archaeon]|jgi:hypothetical protein|nr:hypothetical protein [Nitrososphaerota archaeon]